MTEQQAVNALRLVNKLAAEAKERGNHPFAAVLIAPDFEKVLLSASNLSTLKHAETELVQAAAEKYDSIFLWRCTLVTNFEPCAMCTGAIYWANIGSIVYGVSESELIKLTGNHKDNPTLKMPCREIIKAGSKQVKVFGPFDLVGDEILELHKDFWT